MNFIRNLAYSNRYMASLMKIIVNKKCSFILIVQYIILVTEIIAQDFHH